MEIIIKYQIRMKLCIRSHVKYNSEQNPKWREFTSATIRMIIHDVDRVSLQLAGGS